jgi:hypothetical protein
MKGQLHLRSLFSRRLVEEAIPFSNHHDTHGGDADAQQNQFVATMKAVL